jgi:hypothetical protein
MATATSSRRKSNATQLTASQKSDEQPALQISTPVQFTEQDLTDVRKVIQICAANLTLIRDHLNVCKDGVLKKQNYLLAADLIQHGLNQVLLNVNDAPANRLDEDKIREIVNEAVSSHFSAPQAPTTYSSVAARPTPTAAVHQQKPPAAPKHKVVITPAANCRGVNTAEDTRRILMSKDPSDYGIRADKVVCLKDNAVLVESRCPSVLKLGDSDILKQLKLTAKPVDKHWPRMQIMDVPEHTTQEQLLAELCKQNLPATVPENFTGKMFKYGRRSRGNERGGNDTTSWIVELHPAARAHFVKTERIYTTWRSHNIRDFLLVSRCYKCQRFGHIAKFCNSPRQCGFCASTDHESRDCEAREDKRAHKCANCTRSGIKEANHHTAESVCPIYKHRLQEAINSTNYEVNG